MLKDTMHYFGTEAKAGKMLAPIIIFKILKIVSFALFKLLQFCSITNALCMNNVETLM